MSTSLACWMRIRALRAEGHSMPGQSLLSALPALLCVFSPWPLPAACRPEGFSPCLSYPVQAGAGAQQGSSVLGLSEQLLHVPVVPFSIAQCYCWLKHLHSIIALLEWAPFWPALALKNTLFTAYFSACLKFDASSQLCAALNLM